MHQNRILPSVKKTEVLLDEYFRVEKEALDIPGQPPYAYYSVIASSIAVMVLAKTAEGRYVLNWEYRHPVKKVLLSCPGGAMDKDESPLECARRELLEETGFKAEEFEIIGEAYPFPGICTQKTVYVGAKNAVDTGLHAREHAEFILETVLFSPEELKTRIRKAPVDGLLLSALSFEFLI
jgi:ADP-ribose pyrophosphatase